MKGIWITLLHWHRFAVNPPDINDPAIRQLSNVAKRSKRIAEALIELGRNLTELWTLSSGHTIQPVELTGYDERNLRYHGFWENSYLFDIARHIPWDMGEDAFFQRCISLEVAIIEGLKEGNLRKLLHQLGVPRESIKELRSLKLFYAIVVYSQIAINAGLDLIDETEEVNDRRKEIQPDLNRSPFINTPLKPLFRLHDFRINAAHRGDTVQKLLEEHQIDRASLRAGWGYLLDKFYDDLGEALVSCQANIVG